MVPDRCIACRKGAARHGQRARAARLALLAFLTFLGAVLPHGGRAADPPWPTRPISMVVAYPPGAITDTVGRRVAERLGSALGTSVVVEDRGGAGCNVAAAFVARAPADGHTQSG